MADILSQKEIDELLMALASGQDAKPEEVPEEDQGPAVQPYDFRTANKFSKEQIRMLNFVFDSYSGRLATLLSGALRAVVEVEVVSVEEQVFGEFSNSLPVPTLLAVYNMPPLAGLSLMELSSTIAFEIISCLFGGKGQYGAEIGKPYTEIEVTILQRVITQMLGLMSESWARVTDVSVGLDRIETSAQFAQIVASSEPIIIITMNVRIGDVSDFINVCIPHLAIQPIAKLLSRKSWYDDGAIREDEQSPSLSEINPRIANTQLTMHAQFDTTEVTVHDIVNLQVGDVISLAHPVAKDITVYIEHMPKFRAKMGVKNKRYALRLVDVIEEEEDG